MAGKDKTMRAFVHGALLYGVLLGVFFALLFHSASFGIFGGYFFIIPNRIENVLSISPWLLVGGLIGLFDHFSKQHRMQFSLRFLMLITLLVSLAGAWGVLARSRCQDEEQAKTALQKELSVMGFGFAGFFFPTYTRINLSREPVDSAKIPFLISQIRLLPGLCKVKCGADIISEADLVTLRTTFPDIVFVQE